MFEYFLHFSKNPNEKFIIVYHLIYGINQYYLIVKNTIRQLLIDNFLKRINNKYFWTGKNSYIHSCSSLIILNVINKSTVLLIL